jgi:hypothetical protein
MRASLTHVVSDVIAEVDRMKERDVMADADRYEEQKQERRDMNAMREGEEEEEEEEEKGQEWNAEREWRRQKEERELLERQESECDPYEEDQGEDGGMSVAIRIECHERNGQRHEWTLINSMLNSGRVEKDVIARWLREEKNVKDDEELKCLTDWLVLQFSKHHKCDSSRRDKWGTSENVVVERMYINGEQEIDWMQMQNDIEKAVSGVDRGPWQLFNFVSQERGVVNRHVERSMKTVTTSWN